MRLFTLFALLALGSFALPLVAHAGIPNFEPIIPQGYNTIINGQSVQCPAGWGMLVLVINNIITVLITFAILFVAPIMIAWSGFLFVTNPFNSGGIEQAKKILTNTIIGIIIALAGYAIVTAIMAVLYNPNAQNGGSTLGAWMNLISNTGDACLRVAGAPYTPGTVTVTPVAVTCSISPLSSLTDPLAQQMESGQNVIWGNTDSRLRTCVNRFISRAGGGFVTSAYRPQAYQTHLFEIRDRWCTQGLRSNSNLACGSLKNAVSAEVTRHFGSSWSCGAVAANNSTHSSGTGVDISGLSPLSATVQTAASQSCLTWRNYDGDPFHYDLRDSCTCS